MVDYSNLPYRACAGIMVLNADSQIFVGERIDTPGAWQMPQGGIDPGEDAEAAALRELEEEIGTRNVDVLAQSKDWLSYDLPDHLMGKVWGGRYRGQSQKWFVVRFLGRDDEINIDTAHPEFRLWKWTGAETLPSVIVPFKRELYEDVLREFAHLI